MSEELHKAGRDAVEHLAREIEKIVNLEVRGVPDDPTLFERLAIQQIKQRYAPLRSLVAEALQPLGEVRPCSSAFYEECGEETVELELDGFMVYIMLDDDRRLAVCDIWKKDNRQYESLSLGAEFSVPELPKLRDHVLEQTSDPGLTMLSRAHTALDDAYVKLALVFNKVTAGAVSQDLNGFKGQILALKLLIEGLQGLSYRMNKTLAHFEVADSILGERVYLVSRLPVQAGRPLSVETVSSLIGSGNIFRANSDNLFVGMSTTRAVAELKAFRAKDRAEGRPRRIYEMWLYTPATGAWELKHTLDLNEGAEGAEGDAP
jgi:hypothetical protein